MTTENATPEGVFEVAHSARSNALSEIARKVHQENVADLRGFNEDTGEIEQPAAAGQQATSAAPAAEQTGGQDADQQQPAAASNNTPPDDMEVIVVNGQEQRVKREQVIEAGRRTLQKESAADRRLEEASETLRRAKALEQALLQGRPSSDAGNTNPPPSSDAANGMGAPSAESATPYVRALVKQELWTERANAAAERFAQEFEDIAKDPMSARLVSMLENERLASLAAEGKSPIDDDPWSAYRSHGETVRQWLGKAKPQGQPQVPENKADRKRDTVTVTGSTTRVPPPATPKTPTVGDTIEQMRLSRRQGRQIQPTR